MAERRRVIGSILKAIGTLLILPGVLLLAYQVIIWLRDGVWIAFSIQETINIIFGEVAWLNDTRSMGKIHAYIVWFLSIFPISFLLIMIGVWLSGRGNRMR